MKSFRRRRTSRKPAPDLSPNRKARPIGNRPSMDTSHFGEDLDDETLDALGGPRGQHVDAAMKRYSIFHSKEPIRVAELEHDIPTSWVAVGDALAVMYRTDKWKSYGNDEDYKHLHDKSDGVPYEVRRGVRFFEPASEVKKSKLPGGARIGGRAQRLPVAIPKAITLLGYCLGAFVRVDETGEEYEVNPRGCYLYSSPKGDLLLLYSPDVQPDGSSGFLGAMAGGRLRVLKDGIDG